MIKIGLIGAGFMGTMHANCYQALGESLAGFQVTAVADLDEERASKLAATFGATVYASAAELLEQADINTVDICLPTFLHTRYALQAMDKGYDVFIEKPVCLSQEEADELRSKQQATGKQVMVGQCIRFWPEYVALRQLVEEGRYGRIVAANFSRLSPFPGWDWDGWMHDQQRSGSAALDLHIHDVDFVRSLLGTPETAHAQITRRSGANTHIRSLYGYKEAAVSLEGGWDYPESFPFEMAYQVQFEQATVVFRSSASPALAIYEANGAVINASSALDSGLDAAAAAEGDGGGNITSLGGYYNELRYFVETLQQGKPLEQATLEDGCQSLELLLQVINTAEVREWK